MEGTLALVLPVFAIGLLGFLTTRLGYVTPETIDGMARFVLAVAVPLLVFRTMAVADLDKLFANLAELVLAYYLGALVVLVLAVAVARYVYKHGIGAQAGLAMAASHSNMVLLGIPFVVLILGRNLSAPLLVLVCLHGMLMAFLATLIFKLWDKGTRDLPEALAQVLMDQARSPLFLALAAGLFYGGLDLPRPQPVDLALRLVGSAAVPCGLFVLGGLLAGLRADGRFFDAVTATVLKLAVHPFLVWVIAAKLFSLPASWVWVAVMLATSPTAFEPLEGRRAEGEMSGKAVLLSTPLALVSLTVLTHIIRT